MIIDLSHPIESAIPMFPGFPAPEVSSFVSREASRANYAQGTEFLIQRVAFIGNTGTYLDAPYHRYEDGADLSRLDLSRLCDLPTIVVDVATAVSDGRLGVDLSTIPDDLSGCAVLFRTGWDVKWMQQGYLEANPFLTREVAYRLVESGAVLVGIDSWNADDVRDLSRPVHSILLGAGIPIVENLCNLDRLPASGCRFFAPALPIWSGTAVPVRAFAIIDE